jgi:hypothetical protein
LPHTRTLTNVSPAGMINWKEPDYVSAGHFYALVKSVTIKCNDPEKPGPNITSYKYGKNATAETPSVALSNQTTLLNGAGPTLGSGMQFRGAVAVVAGLLLASHVL